MDGKESVMLTVSKMSLIEEVRRLVKDKLNVEPSCQRLFFRGKQVNWLRKFQLSIKVIKYKCYLQMEDGYRLIDYGININDVVQLMICAAPIPSANIIQKATEEQSEEVNNKGKNEANSCGDEALADVVCEYYEVKCKDLNFYDC